MVFAVAQDYINRKRPRKLLRLVEDAFGTLTEQDGEESLVRWALARDRLSQESLRECLGIKLERVAEGRPCRLESLFVEREILTEEETKTRPWEEGKRIGKYWVRREIARGGMGVVYEAEDPELKRTVALKVRREGREGEEAVERFLREARIAAGLRHPNIIGVHEVGTLEDGAQYIAMDYVAGPTLAEAMQAGKTTQEELLRMMEEVGMAVAFAHGHGVIHRDLKPQNVLLENGERVVLTDFGLARTETGTGRLTMSEELIGTPAYMAPEQARGRTREIDERTDVYALGVMLYEILAGRMPFEGKTPVDVLDRIEKEEPKRPSSWGRKIPKELETICLKAMEKEKRRRYQHASEFAEDLARFRCGEPIRARPISVWGRWVRKARKNPVLAIAGAATCVALLGSIASWIATRRGATREAARIRATQQRREAALKKVSVYQTTILQVQAYRRKTPRNTLKEARDRLAPVLSGIDTFIREWPNEPQGYYLRAKMKMALDDDAGAAEDLKVAVAKSPDFRPGWTFLGLLDDRMSGLECSGAPIRPTDQERKIRLERTLEISRRGWIYGREHEEAERWGLACTEEDQVMALIMQTYSEGHIHGLDCGPDHSQTTTILQQGVDRYSSAECALRLSYLGSDRSVRMTWLDTAISLEPGFAHAYFQRCLLHGESGEWDKMLADAKMATELSETVGEYWHELGNARHCLGDTAGAMEAFTKAVNLMRNPAMAHYNLGTVLLEQHRFEDAMERFRRAIALESRYANAWNTLGLALHGTKKPAEALLAYGRALELNPNHAKTHFNRGNLLMREFREHARAADDYLRATQLDPKYAEAFLNLGRMYLLMQKPDEALRAFDSAIAIREVYPLAWWGVGDARVAKKEWEPAIGAYERALEQGGPKWGHRSMVEQALRRAQEGRSGE